MNYDFDNEIYDKINNFDEDEEIKYKSIFANFKKNKSKKLKNKICKKILLEKFNLKKCLFLLIFILILFLILIEFFSDYNNKYINNIYKILQNIANSKSINNITETNTDNKTIEEIEEEEEKEEEIKPNKEDIYKEEKFDSLNEAFKKAKDFLDKSMKGILLNKPPFISSENPKISAIIPLYNSKNFISRAIKSIQNQNILDLEIILVNDCSTDDTLSVVEKIQKEDPRIRIVKNKKNMGILYSRSIGALNAKGKYIFPLDNDDMFLDKDVFQTISNIADKGDFDLVEFKGVFSLSGGSNLLNNRIQDTYFSGHKLNLVMFQPELGNYPIRPSEKMGNYVIFDVFLWVKCIKTSVYQKALNKLGEERYSRHMLIHEDVVATCILFNTAKSYKFIGKYGTFHIQRSGSASWRSFDDVQTNTYNLYFTDVAIDFTQETRQNKLLLVYLIIFMIERPKLEKTLNNEYNKKLFISCLDRILSSKLISDEHKKLIREKGKKLSYLKYPF